MTEESSRPVTLAVDSAGLACSAVVAIGDTVLSAVRVESRHGQAEILLPTVDTAMCRAGLTPAALNLVAVSVGPGSFTGIRVGLAATRGIALATGARMVGVSSFEAVAANVPRPDRDDFPCVLVALESRRQDIYVQLFDRRRDPIGQPIAVMPAALQEVVSKTVSATPLLIAGDAAQRATSALARRKDIFVLEDSAPDAIGVLRAGLRRWPKEVVDAPRPLYLRPPSVTLSSRDQRSPLGRA
jgi:tRNA threonylcarbamoyladenosine biosynthesis protein TsaB